MNILCACLRRVKIHTHKKIHVIKVQANLIGNKNVDLVRNENEIAALTTLAVSMLRDIVAASNFDGNEYTSTPIRSIVWGTSRQNCCAVVSLPSTT